MKIPRSVVGFNKAINNRVQGLYAWVLPPWAVILHRGRRSGRAYRTPLLAFRRGDDLAIALLYGEESDWLRNLRANGGGRIVRGGRTFDLGPPRIVATDPSALSGLSAPARAYCRLADHQVLVAVGERVGGFGPGRELA
jgi:deazaflavin-dependent oxidoreductase (nitroreductase family)